jgi:hypothetical protein
MAQFSKYRLLVNRRRWRCGDRQRVTSDTSKDGKVRCQRSQAQYAAIITQFESGVGRVSGDTHRQGTWNRWRSQRTNGESLWKSRREQLDTMVPVRRTVPQYIFEERHRNETITEMRQLQRGGESTKYSYMNCYHFSNFGFHSNMSAR